MHALFVALVTAGLVSPGGAYRIVTRDYETAPTTVPAHSHAEVKVKSYPIEEDGWLVEATPMLINGPGYMLHHGIAALVPGEASFCGQQIPATLLWGAGREHNTLMLPNGFNLPDRAYGIPVKKGQRVLFAGEGVMLYNPDDQDYPDVKFRITAKFYVPEEGDPPLKDLEILPLFLTQRPNIHAGQFCPQYKEEVSRYIEEYRRLHPEEALEGSFESTEAHHFEAAGHDHGHAAHSKEGGHGAVTYWIPPKSSKVDRWMLPAEIGSDFDVYAALGHVHDYADYIKLYRNGEEAWAAPLVKDSTGRVVGLPVHLKPGLSFQKGDEIVLETKYTNPHDFPVDAMGIVVLLVHRKGEGELVKFPDKLQLPPVEQAKKAVE